MNYLTIIVFFCIVVAILFLGEMFIRLQEKKSQIDSIVVYKHKTKHSDSDNSKIIKKVNSFYKHGFG